jgi:hypothetical protein
MGAIALDDPGTSESSNQKMGELRSWIWKTRLRGGFSNYKRPSRRGKLILIISCLSAWLQPDRYRY